MKMKTRKVLMMKGITKWYALTLLFSFALLECGDAGIELVEGSNSGTGGTGGTTTLQQPLQQQLQAKKRRRRRRRRRNNDKPILLQVNDLSSLSVVSDAELQEFAATTTNYQRQQPSSLFDVLQTSSFFDYLVPSEYYEAIIENAYEAAQELHSADATTATLQLLKRLSADEELDAATAKKRQPSSSSFFFDVFLLPSEYYEAMVENAYDAAQELHSADATAATLQLLSSKQAIDDTTTTAATLSKRRVPFKEEAAAAATEDLAAAVTTNAVPRGGWFKKQQKTTALNSAADAATVELETETTTTKQLRDSIGISNKQLDQFSLFQENDGSEGPDGLPTRYVIMQNGDLRAAARAVQATLDWRKRYRIDEILIQPRPQFDICKKVFPHYFVGRDAENHVVLLQRPALIDIPTGIKNGLSNEDLLLHYVYVNEYLWQIIEADNALATMTSILDLTGLQLGMLQHSDYIAFLKIFVSTMDSHFPQRAHQTLIVNTPKWFNVIYKLMSPLLRESTKSKIQILSKGKAQDEALKKLSGDDALILPLSLWSAAELKRRRQGRQRTTTEDEQEIPDTLLERELRSYTLARLEKAGIPMQELAA